MQLKWIEHCPCKTDDMESYSLKEKIKEWNSKYGVYPNNINYVKFELLGIKFNR